MTASDDELLAAAALGDGDALSELLCRHGPSVRRSLAGKVEERWQSVLSVDDVLQETFLEAFVAIDGFQPRGVDSFVGWLVRMAHRNLIDAVRELQAAKRGGDKVRVENGGGDPDASYVELFERLGGTTTSPSGAAARKEARQALDEAFQKLPESYRLAVSLYDLADCSAEDAAEACGCSVGALHMRRSRAHAMLREILRERLSMWKPT